MKKLLLACIFLAIIMGCSAPDEVKQVTLDELKSGFANPPQEARVQVWWHWMDGNITKDGIYKDLTWMKRIGLGGFHHFDAGVSTPQIVKDRLVYMTEGWKDAFNYAIELADSLGLEMTVASAPGWSSTGGPWVEPKDAMKKLVWRECQVTGQEINVKLPEPFKTTGRYQNIPLVANVIEAGEALSDQYYEDIAVIAVKLPEADMTMEEMKAEVSSTNGSYTVAQLTDGDMNNSSMIMADPSGRTWIQYTFPQEQQIKSATICSNGIGMMLQYSKDNMEWKDICPINVSEVGSTTIDFPIVKAKYFRLSIANPQETPGYLGIMPSTPAAPGTNVSEFVLYPVTRVHLAEDKAGFTNAVNVLNKPTAQADKETYAHLWDVHNVTDYVDNGKLKWKAPKSGKWRIYRFGCSLTGKKNHPAPPEATGLEVDKLDPEAWTSYFHKYLDMYKNASKGRIGERGIRYILTDSYEAEYQTWTPNMANEFYNRHQYDLYKYMPALAGMIINTPEHTDGFLKDWRETIGELMAENYTRLSEIAKNEYHLKGRYTESHENGRAYIGDGMDLKATAEVPMSAMWMNASWMEHTSNDLKDYNHNQYMMDDKESASVAHIFGQNIAACESMTAMGFTGYAYGFWPGNLKAVADMELASGINRIIIHESAHQPVDDKTPGLSLMSTGQWFNRHETWAEQAKAWIDYLSRSCYLLQQGKDVADILVYYGEDTNVTSLYQKQAPNIPQGYQYDFCSPGTFMSEIAWNKGSFLSGASGAEYKVLWLDNNVDYMSNTILRKLSNMAKAGAIIAGKKPLHPASAADDRGEFEQLVKNIWGSHLENVTEGLSLNEVLKKYKVLPDFTTKTPEIRYIHRNCGDIQIYWVNKPSEKAEAVTATFKVTGLKPQIWHPETGLMEEASFEIKEGKTTVQIPMIANDAVFVVFGEATAETYLKLEEKPELEIPFTESGWDVKFQEGRGAPENIHLTNLSDLSKNSVNGIKYFSGIATYTTTIHVPEMNGKKQFIDLGNVGVMAEVILNGKNVGIAWKSPYKLEVTNVLQKGENKVEVQVATLWKNRLIGDKQPKVTPITFTDMPYYSGFEPLAPSGLMGPLKLTGK